VPGAGGTCSNSNYYAPKCFCPTGLKIDGTAVNYGKAPANFGKGKDFVGAKVVVILSGQWQKEESSQDRNYDWYEWFSTNPDILNQWYKGKNTKTWYNMYEEFPGAPVFSNITNGFMKGPDQQGISNNFYTVTDFPGFEATPPSNWEQNFFLYVKAYGDCPNTPANKQCKHKEASGYLHVDGVFADWVSCTGSDCITKKLKPNRGAYNPPDPPGLPPI
jgi:hypothetical protein